MHEGGGGCLSLKFSIVGTDSRNKYLADELRADGHSVLLANKYEKPSQGSDGEIIVLPLSMSPKANQQFVEQVDGGCCVFSSGITDRGIEVCEDKHIIYTNMLSDDVFCIENAVPTAEGILQYAIEHTNGTIYGMPVCVMGYGRVGKATCRVFSAMDAEVCVVSKDDSERALAKACGLEAIELKESKKSLKDALLVINTIPALIIRDIEVRCMQKECIIIDIASGKGGVDFDSAKKLGLKAVQIKGIPGKTAPRSAAVYMKDSIYRTLYERMGRSGDERY